MEAFGKFTLSTLLGMICILSTSHAVVILWSWFVVPYFHIAPLTWRMAYGFILVLSLVHSIPSPEYEDKTYSGMISRLIGVGIISPWISVLIGWAIK